MVSELVNQRADSSQLLKILVYGERTVKSAYL